LLVGSCRDIIKKTKDFEMPERLFDKLSERGFIKDLTHPAAIRDILNGDRKITFYFGIDPTADSLHIGHFFGLRLFRHLQDAGHKGILLIGGATSQIGDPTGKTDMRKMLTKEDIRYNLEEVKTLAARFILPGTEIVDNSEWLDKMSYVDFMRIVGIHFNINTMLAADAYKLRRENGGLTFLEMGYMPMQAYDFVHLNETKGCVLQIGGSDQWGNIVAGTELFRRMKKSLECRACHPKPWRRVVQSSDEIYGMTAPLLMTADGKKMGKSEKGTMWVARDKTTPFDFYQYFYNMPDENTEMLLKLFTDIPSVDIERLIKQDIIGAKKLMAFEITKLIHGQELADDAVAAASSLFAGGADSTAIPTVELGVRSEELGVIDFVVAVGFIPSKSEARRLIEQGGLQINGEKITDPNAVLAPAESYLLQKGKKTFLKVVVK
jgi:tyrosyl-tRNA synthetase